jgi:hypothetical protein
MDRVRQRNDKMIRKQEAREKVRAVIYSAIQCYVVLYIVIQCYVGSVSHMKM